MPRIEPQRLSSGLPWRLLVLGLLASVAAAYGWHRAVEMQIGRDIATRAADLEAKIRARFLAHLALLRGTRGLFASLPEVRREHFRRYVEEVGIGENYPGIQGIGFSRRVAEVDLSELEAAARRDGRTEFQVWPAGPREEYHAIMLLEPEDARNLAAIGYDMHTDPVRRAAMELARDSGQPTMTGRVTLVQEIDQNKQAGFLIYVPLYAGVGQPGTVEERRNQLVGHVYAPFRAGDFVQAITEWTESELALSVYDHSSEDESLLFAWAPSEPLGRRMVQRARSIEMANRVWTIVYSAPGAGLGAPLAIFLGGLMVTAGAALLVRRERHAWNKAERSALRTMERERELALLVEWVPAVVIYVDRAGILRLCNQRFHDWFGLEPKAVIGKPWPDALGPQGFRESEAAAARALAGEAATAERWHILPTGARYLATSYVPLRDPKGAPNGFYALMSDLTGLKRAEERARFVADCGRLLISSMDYETAARGVVELAVPQVADLAVMFRVNGDHLRAAAVAHADETIERKLDEFVRPLKIAIDAPHGIAIAARTGLVGIIPDVQPADVDRATSDPVKRAILRELEVRSAMHVPVVVRGQVWAVFSLGAAAASGRRFSDEDRSLAEEISTRVRLAVENALLFHEAQQEIEERRRAQRTARETEERFRLLVAGARDYAIILVDAAGQIESWNEGAEHIFGFTEAEAAGLPLARLSSAEDQRAGTTETEFARARESDSVLDERWYVRRDGTRFWASGHTVALRDEAGNLRGYAKILRDLTERKKTEEDLERRVQERTMELNEAVQELEAFSYSVSHDLRSPLRSIRGFTELALEEAGPRLTETERNYLERVQRAVSRLDRLISDLLAYTRVSKTKVTLGPVALHTLVSDIRRDHPEFQAPRADVRIEGELLSVIGHETYLTQALTNLLGNAVKFVKPGETPQVRVWTEARGPAVRLYVRDNGIGIPRAHAHRAFEMFERLHTREGYEGTGVGLAIVRRAVQRMKGTVGLESVEGEGTTFWIELPAVGAGVGTESGENHAVAAGRMLRD